MFGLSKKEKMRDAAKFVKAVSLLVDARADLRNSFLNGIRTTLELLFLVMADIKSLNDLLNAPLWLRQQIKDTLLSKVQSQLAFAQEQGQQYFQAMRLSVMSEEIIASLLFSYEGTCENSTLLRIYALNYINEAMALPDFVLDEKYKQIHGQI